MIDLVVPAVFVVGLLSMIARLSWSPRKAGIAAVAIMLGALPLALGETVAGLSRGRVLAWLAAPETGKTLSLILVAEGLLTGAAAFRVLASGAGPRGLGLLAAVPGPGLILGLVGMEMLMFHHVTGLDFSLLAWGLGLSVAVVLGGAAWAFARAAELERRAEMGVRLAASQFLLGATLPLLLRPPQTQPGAGGINTRAAVLAPPVLLAIVLIGFLARRFRRPRPDPVPTPDLRQRRRLA